MTTLGHHIGGARVPGTSDHHGPVYNPATGEITKHVCFGTRNEVDRAVAVAKEASVDWARTTPIRRARVMFRFL